MPHAIVGALTGAEKSDAALDGPLDIGRAIRAGWLVRSRDLWAKTKNQEPNSKNQEPNPKDQVPNPKN
jgi:hypothetical protein